jgi:anti-sigma factor RsiW
VAQHNNEHLTNTELSAFLDKALTPEEMALCDAHIQTCQVCRTALADLRLTSALLGGMPQVAVPRSFVLPANLLTLPETPSIRTKTATTAARPPSPAPTLWKRTMRTASTLVAILGLFFCLAGLLSALPHGGATMSTAPHSSAGNAPAVASRGEADATASVLATATFQGAAASPNAVGTRIAATSTGTHLKATPTPTSTQHTYDSTTPSTPQTPALLDLSQPGGRLVVGGSLILLGLLGVIATHLFERSARR